METIGKNNFQEDKKKVLKVGIVDLSKIAEAQAVDIADSKMTESKEDRSKNWFIRTGKRIWKHNIAQEWYRQREIGRAKKEIFENDNLYIGETEKENKEEYEQAKKAILERFVSEYEDEMLKKEEKESKKSITDEKIKSNIKELLKQFAGDATMSEEAFKEEQNRILSSTDSAYAKKEKLYVSNLLDLAKEIRNSVAHGEKLSEMDFDVDITLGQARESLNTKAEHSAFEKIMNSKVGKYFFNEPAAVSIAAGLYSAGNFLGMKVLRSKIAQWGTFGATALLAGGVSAAKESARLNRERVQHIRESAKGMEFKEDDMKRRQEMDQNKYETKNASEILKNLEEDLLKVSSGNVKENELDAILINLSDLETRIKLGDQKNIDLVSYSRFSEVEKERMNLDLCRAKIKVAIRKGIEDKKIEFTKGTDFDAYLKQIVDFQSEDIGKDIEKKDQIFKAMKKKKVASAFVKTVLVGASAGFVFQEAQAAFQSDNDGIIEGAFKGNHASHATALEGLRRWITGNDNPHIPFGNGHEMILNNTHMQLPEGVSINPNPDGTFDIMHGDNIVSDNVRLGFTPNGDLTDASKEILAKDGILSNFNQTGGKVTEHITRNAGEYINKHPELTEHIHRSWMDNDTPMHPDPDNPGHLLGADKNELKLEWGGVKGSGIDENGNYVFQVQHMTDDGSYHDGLSVAAHEQMKKGGLEILLSVTKGTQQTVIPVKIDEFGKAIIDHASENGKMLFENVNGHAVFDGAYAEVGHSTGLATDGTKNMQILATHIGTDHANEVTETIIRDTTVPNVKLDIPANWDYDVPPFIPIGSRRPLESMSHKESTVIPYYFGGSGFLSSEEQRQQYRVELSETLKENPNATLDQSKEINTYLKKLDNNYLRKLEEIKREMGPMGKDCRLTVCIPVAGHQEGKNIYETLKNYSSQTVQNDKFEIALFVNYPEKDRNGNKIKPDETLEEINRFKKDYPNINICVSERVLPNSDATIGHIRKVLNDVVLLRQSNRGKDTPELIMVSNDADNKGLATKYIENFILKFDKQKNVDSMVGQLDWDPRSYIRNPLIHIGTRLFQYDGAQAREKGWHFNSSGANFAFRSSVYAAVGGYTDNMKGGEDTDLGAKITSARKGSKEKIPIAFAGALTSRLYTSSRRAETVMKNYGLAPIEQWDKGFSAFDDEVRKVDWENKKEKIDYKNKEEVNKLISSLETVINRTIKKGEMWGGSVNSDSIKRSLRWLGIKYEVTGTHSIKITDATKLIKGLEQYQNEGLKILEKKITLEDEKENRQKKEKNKSDLTKPSSEKQKESQAREEMSKKDFEEEMYRTFSEIVGKDNQATIEKLNVDIKDNKIIGHAELKATKKVGGTPIVDIELTTKDDKLVFNGKPKIKANMLAIGSISDVIKGVPSKVTEVLEKKYKKTINSIKIENGKLSLTFKE